MDTVWQDLRFAVRTLIKSWSVTLLATVSLALAIAGNTIVFSLVNGLLYRPLPYAEVERLSLIGERPEGTPTGLIVGTSEANFVDYTERQTSFDLMSGYRTSTMNFDRGGDKPDTVRGARVSPEFFRMLGTQAALGRLFADEEGIRGNHRVAVLSHRFWTDRFGGAGLPEGPISLNGEPYDVVGVLPESFEFVFDTDIQLWVPLALDRAHLDRQQRSLLVLGRLAPGVSQDTARAEMTTILKHLADEHPEANRGWLIDVLNLREDFPDSRNRLFLYLVQGAMVFLLLIACANVANLLLARSQKREREIAIRTSIGASRRHIVGQMFTESFVMAIAAGALGVVMGAYGVRLVARFLAAQLPSFFVPVVDTRVVLYSLAVTLVGGFLFGLAPVIQTYRFDLLSSLKDGTQASTQSGRRRLASQALVVFEIALALIFLGGSSIMIRSFQVLQNTDPGFDADNMVTVVLNLPESRYATDPEVVAGAERIGAELASVPGVTAVAVSDTRPRVPLLPNENFEIDARPTPEEQPSPRAGWIEADPAYFDTVGIPLRRGRLFTAADRLDAAPVVVINETLANRFWEGQDPIGQRLTVQGASREIVGVVADVRHALFGNETLNPVVYVPWAQKPGRTMTFLLRTAVDPATVVDPARLAVVELDPQVIVAQVQTLHAFVEQFWVGQQLFTVILGAFGSLALALAALGTYGVLAYSVAQRTHEIGVRMAIGAGRLNVVRMITRQGLVLALIGIGLGSLVIPFVSKAIESIMAGFVAVEPMTVVGVAVVLTIVTLVASFIPAQRAASVDPIRALRWE